MLGQSRRNHLVAYLYRERNIHQPIPVNMPDFAASQTKLPPAEAVGMSFYTLPSGNGFFNSSSCAFDGHTPSLYLRPVYKVSQNRVASN